MNIRYTIYMLAAIGLTACSGDDDVRNASPDEQQLTREQMVSDVPIDFAPIALTDLQWEAGDLAATRGVSLDVSPFTMDNVGIFCLAKKKLPDGPMNPLWDGSNKTYKAYHVWEDNVNVSIKGIGNNQGVIQWDRTFQLHYYPSDPWYAYGFMAYHPWTDCLVRAAHALTAYFKVDGNDDVIHAICPNPEKSFGDDAVDGLAFSKQYFDEIRTRGWDFEGTYPKLEFRHLMSRLDFYFCLNGTPLENIHVDKVEFNSFPSVMVVPLAEKNRTTGVMSSNIGSTPYVINQAKLDAIKFNSTDLLVDVYPEMSPCFDHFELREKGETPISGQTNRDGSYKYNLTTDMQKVGDCILIPPVAKSHSKANIGLFVTLSDDSGHKYKNKTAITLTCPNTGWVMGTRYNVRITLNSPVGIVLAPELDTPAPRRSASSTDGEITLWQPDAKVTITPRE